MKMFKKNFKENRSKNLRSNQVFLNKTRKYRRRDRKQGNPKYEISKFQAKEFSNLCFSKLTSKHINFL